MKKKKVDFLFIIFGVSLFFTSFFLKIDEVYFLILFVCWFIITAIGSSKIGLNYHLNSLNSNLDTTNKIAITFDDGPDLNTLSILETLKKHNVKATFFCIGIKIELYPHIFQQIVKDGHSIGNHTYNHSNFFGFLSTKKVKEEIEKTEELIYKYSAKKSIGFRPPFGITNPSIAKAIKEMNLKVFGWNIRSFDTCSKNETKLLNKINHQLKAGSVILLHDNQKITVSILDELLVLIKDKNLNPVTVEKLFLN